MCARLSLSFHPGMLYVVQVLGASSYMLWFCRVCVPCNRVLPVRKLTVLPSARILPGRNRRKALERSGFPRGPAVGAGFRRGQRVGLPEQGARGTGGECPRGLRAVHLRGS